MPRPRYQIADEDVPVVYRWVHAKCRDTVWPQYDAARSAWDAFPRAHPTATQLQQWCDQYLDATQWTQLQAVIRAARRDTRQTRTVRLSTSAYTRLHNLAAREQLTLSATIDRYLSDMTATPPPQTMPATTEQAPAKQAAARTGVQKRRHPAVVPQKQSSAFITTKKGVCYLTIKIGRQNFSLMRLRNYTIDAQDKRDMRRLHPDVAFGRVPPACG
jgi:hypothetical protein